MVDSCGQLETAELGTTSRRDEDLPRVRLFIEIHRGERNSLTADILRHECGRNSRETREVFLIQLDVSLFTITLLFPRNLLSFSILFSLISNFINCSRIDILYTQTREQETGVKKQRDRKWLAYRARTYCVCKNRIRGKLLFHFSSFLWKKAHGIFANIRLKNRKSR